MYKYLIIYILIVVICLIFYKLFLRLYNDNNLFIEFVDKENELIFQFLNKHIDSFNSNELFIRNNQVKNKKNLKFIYKKNIENFNNSEKIKLKFIIKKINRYYFPNKKWYLVKTNDKIEKNMAFTLDKYIFLPSSYINNNNITDLAETLIHEKIHIIQRFNKQIFFNFYTQQLNFDYTNKIINKHLLNNIQITNPDGIEINWIFKKKNKYYLPINS